MSYEIVRVRSEHRPMVVELQRSLWSPDAQLNSRYFEWKYERNPYSRGLLAFLALHEGRAVGMRGFHGALWEAGTPSESFPVWMADDTVVRETHRDRGLVSRIVKHAFADPDLQERPYVFSAAASRVTVFGLLTAGFRSAGAMRPQGRVSAGAERAAHLRDRVRRLPGLWRLADSLALGPPGARRPFRHLDKRLGPQDGAQVAIEADPRPDAMAQLVERLGHDGRVRHVRDAAYLRWRFANPLHEYRFVYHGSEPLSGYLVLGRRRYASPARVHIVDLEAGAAEVRDELLSVAIRSGKFAELVIWTGTLRQPECNALSKHGFVDIDAHETQRGCPCVLVRPTRQIAEWTVGGRALLTPANWDMRLLYSGRG